MTEGRLIRAEHVLWQTIGDKTVVIGDDGLSVHVFNKTAAPIWEMCDGDLGPDGIAANLCERYDVPFEQASIDVRKVIARMEKLGLLKHADSAKGEGNMLLHRILFRLVPQSLRHLFSLQRSKITRSFMRRYVRQRVCQRCARCCDGTLFLEAGLYAGEGLAISRHLGMATDEFFRKYCLESDSQQYLRLPCPFLVKDSTLASCHIYEVRPGACRFFPLSFSKERKTWKIHPGCPAGRELSRLFGTEQTTTVTQHTG